MNPMDFMQSINDIDEALIQSSMDFLQEDTMKKTFKRGGSTLSKVVLVAAMLAGILGVTAYAAEAFPSIFGQLKREYAQQASQHPEAQKEADLYERAAEVNETFEAKTFQLPELSDSQITIGETYYDGCNLMIAYRMDQSVTAAQFGYGPDSEGFENLGRRGNVYEDGSDTFEELLKNGHWDQETYDSQVKYAKETGLDSIDRISILDTLDSMKQELTDEEYAKALQELKEKGRVGVVTREMYIGDHILVEGEDCLVPNKEGYLWWEDVTEYGRSLKSRAFNESLPEKYQKLDTLTLSLKVRANNIYYYIDLETGGVSNYESAGEILVPVTLTKTPE
ncbi:MAG: hypothetical protein Q4F17_11105 [Eubacteriales bacterium]|nr:hypothetical protein [Eubacteriales bacterium]